MTPAEERDVIGRLLRRDRLLVSAGLVAVILLAWGFLLASMEWSMSAMPHGAMMMPGSWSASYTALMALMWTIMMPAMMLPSAAPMILLFATFNRKRRLAGTPYVSTGVFVLGYLLVWIAFSVAATFAQRGLEELTLLSPMGASISTGLSVALLAAAGLYQLTPLKHACLRHCRSPLAFVMHHWREGKLGALRMGIEHGAYCLGCCWALMALLFVGGVMNLFWIGAIAALVLLEKTAPAAAWISRLAGLLLISAGVILLIQ